MEKKNEEEGGRTKSMVGGVGGGGGGGGGGRKDCPSVINFRPRRRGSRGDCRQAVFDGEAIREIEGSKGQENIEVLGNDTVKGKGRRKEGRRKGVPWPTGQGRFSKRGSGRDEKEALRALRAQKTEEAEVDVNSTGRSKPPGKQEVGLEGPALTDAW